jgi:predicted ATP-dependent serine protease
MGDGGLEKLIFGGLGALIGTGIDESRKRNEITRFEAIKRNARIQIYEIDKQLKAIEYEEKFTKTLTKSNVITEPNLEGVREIATKDVMSLSQFQNMMFETLDFSGSEYKDLIGNPQPNFLICIYGVAGNGKSTRALKFAEYLSNNHGRVLYNSSEEGFRASMQSKVKDFKANYFHISNHRKFDDLKNLIDKNPARFIFIDSVNDMDITPEQLAQLRKKFPARGFVIVMQATKAGTYKGDSAFAHDADVIMKLENRQPIIEKTRFM